MAALLFTVGPCSLRGALSHLCMRPPVGNLQPAILDCCRFTETKEHLARGLFSQGQARIQNQMHLAGNGGGGGGVIFLCPVA